MAKNDRSVKEGDYGCFPYERIKEVHDKVRDNQPEEPDTTTTEKLMKPQSGDPGPD